MFRFPTIFFQKRVRFVQQEEQPTIRVGIQPILDMPKKRDLICSRTHLFFIEHAFFLQPRHQHAPKSVDSATATEEFALEVNKNGRPALFEIMKPASKRPKQRGFTQLPAAVNKTGSPQVGERRQLATPTEKHLRGHITSGDAIRLNARKRQGAAEETWGNDR